MCSQYGDAPEENTVTYKGSSWRVFCGTLPFVFPSPALFRLIRRAPPPPPVQRSLASYLLPVPFCIAAMRSFDPTLPSISFVLSQAQNEPRRLRRRPSRRVRRAKSSPSFSPHVPHYPPQLESDFLMKTVDYRFNPPPCPSMRSRYALPTNLFIADEVEIEIVMPSPTESTSSSTSSTSHTSSARKRAKAVSTFVQVRLGHVVRALKVADIAVQDVLDTVRYRWRGLHPVKRAEDRLSFDLCN
ncbi:hypothetical protein FA95DRAFT_1560983 [Auriscalpium vulgare]|uniref:Uncharacterized protein n=1 Tax=Auriscalpium vulgare TaxID=40419 RepID=A0ACB8RNR1_9AGAM|nr:hypothetical protein FA95DRAFT_1560983 [Auriscalpium vulgare]